jgi:hypothetical protein
MKLSRRCFLSFAIGAAVGINLTPLPWKLTDDLSIWTQMWPWTPVPSDGEYTLKTRSAPFVLEVAAYRFEKWTIERSRSKE